MPDEKLQCPFVYANGKHCKGTVRGFRCYGPKHGDYVVARADVKKYRLWCSEKDDHAGAISTWESKERMEFYPNQLPEGYEDKLWQSVDMI